MRLSNALVEQRELPGLDFKVAVAGAGAERAFAEAALVGGVDADGFCVSHAGASDEL